MTSLPPNQPRVYYSAQPSQPVTLSSSQRPPSSTYQQLGQSVYSQSSSYASQGIIRSQVSPSTGAVSGNVAANSTSGESASAYSTRPQAQGQYFSNRTVSHNTYITPQEYTSQTVSYQKPSQGNYNNEALSDRSSRTLTPVKPNGHNPLAPLNLNASNTGNSGLPPQASFFKNPGTVATTSAGPQQTSLGGIYYGVPKQNSQVGTSSQIVKERVSINASGSKSGILTGAVESAGQIRVGSNPTGQSSSTVRLSYSQHTINGAKRPQETLINSTAPTTLPSVPPTSQPQTITLSQHQLDHSRQSQTSFVRPEKPSQEVNLTSTTTANVARPLATPQTAQSHHQSSVSDQIQRTQEEIKALKKQLQQAQQDVETSKKFNKLLMRKVLAISAISQ